MNHYQHIFFDLDHTLWDFTTNSKEALRELYHRHELVKRGISSFDRFYEVYVEVNDRYWTLYRVGKVTKKTLRKIRFQSTLARFGIDDNDFGAKFGEDYIAVSPFKTALLPHAIDTLDYLKQKGYTMHIITNGFEEVQHIKVREAKLEPYFEHLITSEAVQARKPNPLIYEYAFKTTGARPAESIMIGDNLEADVVGARKVGMAQVYFNPGRSKHDEKIDHEIRSLIQLKEFL